MSAERKDGMGKHLKWPLLASLAVNLFLGGVLVGHVYSKGWSHFFSPPRPAPHMMKDLSPESREIAHDVFRQHSEQVRALGRELKEERAALQKVFATEPFDEARAAAMLAEIGRLDSLVQAEMRQATMEIARKLPAEERQKLNLRWKRDYRSDKHRGDAKEARGDRMPPRE